MEKALLNKRCSSINVFLVLYSFDVSPFSYPREELYDSHRVNSIVHEFLVGDKLHPHSKAIYEMSDEVDRLLTLHGHVPDTSEVLYDMDEDLKEGALSHHSERLAIAYG